MTAAPAELLALAERCEMAMGTDYNAGRALGREVLLLCGKGYVSPLYAWHNPVLSLDAAMGLVPDGWRIWTADFSIKGRFVWMLCGPKLTWVTHEDGSREGGNDWYQSGAAANPALALAAAALRARAQEVGE